MLESNIESIEDEFEAIKSETQARSAVPKAKGATRDKIELAIEKLDEKIRCANRLNSVSLLYHCTLCDVYPSLTRPASHSAAKMLVTDRSEGAEVALGTYVSRRFASLVVGT